MGLVRSNRLKPQILHRPRGGGGEQAKEETPKMEESHRLQIWGASNGLSKGCPIIVLSLIVYPKTEKNKQWSQS